MYVPAPPTLFHFADKKPFRKINCKTHTYTSNKNHSYLFEDRQLERSSLICTPQTLDLTVKTDTRGDLTNTNKKANLGPRLPLVLLVILHEMRPHGAVVARRCRGDHGARLHAVAELDRLRAKRGRVVKVAAALGQLGEELGAVPEGGRPADGPNVFPEDRPATARGKDGAASVRYHAKHDNSLVQTPTCVWRESNVCFYSRPSFCRLALHVQERSTP